MLSSCCVRLRLLRETDPLALQSVGLDPYLGFITSHDAGDQPSTRDMMEEFRPLIAVTPAALTRHQ